MRTITALGRRFDAGPNGRLLDQDGNETRFPVMELEIFMEGARGLAMFTEAQPGDTVAELGANCGADGRKVLAEHYVLVRDGRAVAERDTHGTFID